MPQCCIDTRHDLGGEELHGTLRELGVHPVMACVDQITKISNVLMKCQNLVYYRVDGSCQNQSFGDEVCGDFAVRHIVIGFKEIATTTVHKLTRELLEVKVIGATFF